MRSSCVNNVNKKFLKGHAVSPPILGALRYPGTQRNLGPNRLAMGVSDARLTLHRERRS